MIFSDWIRFKRIKHIKIRRGRIAVLRSKTHQQTTPGSLKTFPSASPPPPLYSCWPAFSPSLPLHRRINMNRLSQLCVQISHKVLFYFFFISPRSFFLSFFLWFVLSSYCTVFFCCWILSCVLTRPSFGCHWSSFLWFINVPLPYGALDARPWVLTCSSTDLLTFNWIESFRLHLEVKIVTRICSKVALPALHGSM